MTERRNVVPINKNGTMPKQVKQGGIIHSEKVSKQDEETLIRLYKAMTSEEFSQDIDISLIWEEGIPYFESQLGEKDWEMVWKFFSNGYKQKNAKKEKKVKELLSKLSTIDNACHYVKDFKYCVELFAKLVWDAPEDMSEIVKAKFLRAFEVLFGEFHFMAEDFAMVSNLKNGFKKRPIENEIIKNNKQIYFPERMFNLYDLKLSESSEGGFIYPLMLEMVNELPKELRKEFFRFAELQIQDGKIVDKNEAVNLTFGEIRKLKMRMIPNQGYFPVESFVYLNKELSTNVVVVYQIYRILGVTEDWTTLPSVEKEIDDLECGHLVKKKQTYYQLTESFFATIQEMKILKRYFEYLEDHEYEFMAYYKYSDIPVKKQIKFNLKLFMAAQRYFQELEYYQVEDVNLEVEFFLANILFEEFDCEDALRRYMEGKISCQEFRDELGINDQVDQEVFHVTFIESPENAFESFVEEEGFSLNDENRERALKIIFEGNEKAFEDFSVDRISYKELKKAIHYNKEVVEQIFDLTKVDFAAIEEYLMSIKNNSSKMAKIKNDTLLIKLYCYLVTNSIACGPKRKKAKANRRLKVSNLENLIR